MASIWKRAEDAESNRTQISHERSPDAGKRGWTKTLELVNELHAGMQGLFDAWLEQLRLTLIGLAWVALGSAVGGAARFFVSGFIGRRVGETFPWGTMVVNVTGAFAIGIIAAAAIRDVSFHVPDSWQFAVVGILGSYTTVSSLSLQTLALARDGEYARAGGNVLLSLALGLPAVALGFAVGTAAIGWGAP
jgi:fluoride exporter